MRLGLSRIEVADARHGVEHDDSDCRANSYCEGLNDWFFSHGLSTHLLLS
jgi:hypothetical protein